MPEWRVLMMKAGRFIVTLEGGADVRDTYSFAWLHYAVASLGWRA